MVNDLLNALHLIRFTDQETVKLEQFFKQNGINEQNKTKQSEIKEGCGRTKDDVYTNKHDICMF